MVPIAQPTSQKDNQFCPAKVGINNWLWQLTPVIAPFPAVAEDAASPMCALEAFAKDARQLCKVDHPEPYDPPYDACCIGEVAAIMGDRDGFPEMDYKNCIQGFERLLYPFLKCYIDLKYDNDIPCSELESPLGWESGVNKQCALRRADFIKDCSIAASKVSEIYIDFALSCISSNSFFDRLYCQNDKDFLIQNCGYRDACPTSVQTLDPAVFLDFIEDGWLHPSSPPSYTTLNESLYALGEENALVVIGMMVVGIFLFIYWWSEHFQQPQNDAEDVDPAQRNRANPINQVTSHHLPDWQDLPLYKGMPIPHFSVDCITHASLEETINDSSEKNGQFLKVGGQVHEFSCLCKWLDQQPTPLKDLGLHAEFYFLTSDEYAKLNEKDKATIQRGELLIYRKDGDYKVGIVPLRFDRDQIDFDAKNEDVY